MFLCLKSSPYIHEFFVQVNIGIDGQEGMKLIFGIIVVEGKGNQGKVAKVNLENLFFFSSSNHHFERC